MKGSEILILGANGQLGLALQEKYPAARHTDTAELDITNSDSVDNYNWGGTKVIINAAAYTNVDGAETAEGRVAAWSVNAAAVVNLSRIASKYDLTLVHISTDYVFDGTRKSHKESEPFSPLGVYGQSKAAGDVAATLTPKHYILRTSWVIGQGKNFVRTMLGLGQRGIDPSVVSDQIGRLTFTSELVRIIDYLLQSQAPFGTYNATNSGEPASWVDIAREIFACGNYDCKVSDTTTSEYFASKPGVAPRPLNSIMELDKLQRIGFSSHDWQADLKTYIEEEMAR